MNVFARACLTGLMLLMTACGVEVNNNTNIEPPKDQPQDQPSDKPIKTGVAVLGGGVHTAASVVIKPFAGPAEGLNRPRDLAFNPEAPADLWIPNYADNSMVILKNAGTPQQTKLKKSGPGSEHFMPRPVGIAFGQSGRMATVHEEDRITQPSTPANFMGPTLWSTDSSFEGGHESHYDMLHNSPNAVGIAWERLNIYWVFDGYHNSITRYDFASDHGPGGADHSDGFIGRYVEGQVSYTRGVSSHMEFDQKTKLLYIADTGNHRIAVLKTDSGKAGASLSPNYDGCPQYRVNDAVIATFADTNLKKPSGLALRDGLVFVSDNETSQVLAFDANAQLVDYLDLSSELMPGSLMGIEFDAQGRLYVVDEKTSRVLQISAKPEN